MTKRLITFEQLRELKGISYSRTSITRKMKEGTFPESVRVGPARIAWPEDKLDAWIADLETGHADNKKRAKKDAQ